jgi:transketolase
MEGINHEAIGLAGHLKLGRLIVLWDDNKITIDGAVSLSSSEDIPARYTATGWHVVECDGHDEASIAAAFNAALADDRPSLVRCRTIIGKGAPNARPWAGIILLSRFLRKSARHGWRRGSAARNLMLRGSSG